MSMAISRQSIYAPQPATTRASPTQLSVDPKGERLAYACGKSIFLRSIDDPSKATQYTSHTAVTTVARFSPSGYYIASGDSSGMIRVWDAIGEDMNTKGEFPIISGPIRDLAWDGESKRIIAVGDGKERFGACVTFDTGNSVGEITGQSSVLNSVAIRQQRPYRAVTASDDQTLVFYHGAPFKFNILHRGLHTGFVQGVAFAPDGSYFVSVGADRKIFIFEGKTGEKVGEILDGHAGSVLSVSWSPDSKSFATASADQTVKIWDLETREATQTWKLGGDGSPSLPNHQVSVVWTARSDNLIILLSLSGDLNYLIPGQVAPKSIIKGHQKALSALTTAKDGTILTGSADGVVCCWSNGTATPITDGQAHTNIVSSLAPLSDSTIASVSWDDTLKTISLPNGTFSSTISISAQPVAVVPLPSGGRAVLTVKSLLLYTPNSQTPTEHALSYTPTALGVSKTHFAIGSQDSKIRILTHDLKLVTELTANRSTTTALAYSPDGSHLAGADSTGKIVLYDVAGGYSVKTTRWAFHTARVESVAWNNAGTHVASGGLDCSIIVYSVERPVKNRRAKNAHEGGVMGVAWEGEEGLISAGVDGAVKRWKIEGGLP